MSDLAPAEQVYAAMDELHRVQVHIDAALAAVEAAGTFEDVLEFLGQLHDTIDVLKDMAEVVGRRAIELAPDRFESYPVPGGGIFKTSGGRERTSYDNPRLVSAFATAIQSKLELLKVVTEDSEVHDAAATVENIVTTIAAATGALAPSFSGWRSGIAKDHGIKLNDYAEVSTTDVKYRIESRRST